MRTAEPRPLGFWNSDQGSVTPNPAQPGEVVTVSAPGHSQVTAHVDGSNEEIVVDLDKSGKGKFKVPKEARGTVLIYSTEIPPKLLFELKVVASQRPK